MKKGMEMLLSADTNEVMFVVDLTKTLSVNFYVTFFKPRLFDGLVFTANVKGLSSSENKGKVKIVDREAMNLGVNGALFTFKGQGLFVQVEANVHDDKAKTVSVNWSDNFDDLL